MRDESHEVLTTSNGTEALTLLDSVVDIGLVVLDLIIPGISGWEVLAELRRHRASVAVIIVSALPPSGALEVAAYLQKPFPLDALLRAISRTSVAWEDAKHVHKR
jgi:DNA-binding response OmpR family regulator